MVGLLWVSMRRFDSSGSGSLVRFIATAMSCFHGLRPSSLLGLPQERCPVDTRTGFFVDSIRCLNDYVCQILGASIVGSTEPRLWEARKGRRIARGNVAVSASAAGAASASLRFKAQAGRHSATREPVAREPRLRLGSRIHALACPPGLGHHGLGIRRRTICLRADRRRVFSSIPQCCGVLGAQSALRVRVR
jgi:hypothetical protein